MLQKELEDIFKTFIPEPTYKFKIGDRVMCGGLEDVFIEDVVKDGMVYLLDFTSINRNYGNIKYNYNQKKYAKWIDIRKYQDNESDEFIKNRDIKMSFMQQTVNGLIYYPYYFGLDFNPAYQRDFVWELKDKVSLIDSIFNNVEIGKFVFIPLEYGNQYQYEILDGKQRLRAIMDFYEDRFQYKGKYYSDISITEQRFFKNFPVSIAETSENMSEEQKLRYFINLNKNGKAMSEQQISKVEGMLLDITND